jgi:hypothetical protein
LRSLAVGEAPRAEVLQTRPDRLDLRAQCLARLGCLDDDRAPVGRARLAADEPGALEALHGPRHGRRVRAEQPDQGGGLLRAVGPQSHHDQLLAGVQAGRAQQLPGELVVQPRHAAQRLDDRARVFGRVGPAGVVRAGALGAVLMVVHHAPPSLPAATPVKYLSGQLIEEYGQIVRFSAGQHR